MKVHILPEPGRMVIRHAGAPELCLLQAEGIAIAGLFSPPAVSVALRNVLWSFRAELNLLGL